MSGTDFASYYNDWVDRCNARIRAELRDHLDALDDAATETALTRLLTDAPDLTRHALRALADIDPDTVRDALNETGNPA